MSLETSSPGAHTPNRPHSSFGLSAPTEWPRLASPSAATGERGGFCRSFSVTAGQRYRIGSADEDRDPLNSVVRVAADVPRRVERLRGTRRVRGTTHQHPLARTGVPRRG